MINEYEDLDIYRIKTDQKLNKKKIKTDKAKYE